MTMLSHTQKYQNVAQKLEHELATMPIGHPLRELLESAKLLLTHAAGDGSPPADHDTTRVALIDRGYHWNRIDARTPHGAKMQLINQRYGVAIYGAITAKERFFTHWAPLPTFRD